MIKVNSISPVQTYFESLTQWSAGDPDYIQALANHVQVEGNQEVFIQQFTNHLIETVSCALYNDQINTKCFTLVGAQGCGKSSFIRFLVPEALDNYYMETGSIDHLDTTDLNENFMINLDAHKRIEIRTLLENPAPGRIASFFGSTNHPFFTENDTTFKVKSIDFGYAKSIDIDGVWAQAYALAQTNKG